MKKLLLLSSLSMLSMTALAQVSTFDGVPMVGNDYGQKINRPGTVSVGQAPDGLTTWVYDIPSNSGVYYENFLFGNGNVISDNGIVVGSLYNEISNYAAIIKDGKVIRIETLPESEYYFSDLHGITPDGSRIVGTIPNTHMEGSIYDDGFNDLLYLPFYIDLLEDGSYGKVNVLPCPTKDFFGAAPQASYPFWISEDGHVIAGQMLDSTGMYIYPIIFTEDENGKWSYDYPCKDQLFNPNGYEITAFPESNVKPVDVYDYISDEWKRQQFKEALEQYQATFDPDSDPYNFLDLYMTPEEEEAYNKAVEEYMEAMNYYEEVILPAYRETLSKVMDESVNFLQGSMSMNSAGTMIACSRSISLDGKVGAGEYFPVQNYVPYIIDLTDDTYRVCGTEEDRIIPNQILPGGYVVGTSPMPNYYSPDITPTHSSILMPGADRFIEIEEYLALVDPEKAEWMMKNLYKHVPVALDENGEIVYKDMVVSGNVSLSDDLSVMSAGIDGYSYDDTDDAMYFTIILTGLSAPSAVKSISLPDDGLYRVFNLQGINVLNTMNADDIANLQKGIYIINGRKVKNLRY